jgi:hypothetical protein
VGASGIRPDQREQWWLAELDEYDNPTLTDGAHSTEQGAHHALYLMQRLGLARDGRFAVAHVFLLDAKPDPRGANEGALDTMAAVMAWNRGEATMADVEATMREDRNE